VNKNENKLAQKSETDLAAFEKQTPELKPTVQIDGLSKQFRVGLKKKPAVINLSLDLYESQITCLLGHNGAGKTSTIYMLCGN
jgi:ABC-type uncharacterized transport system ATPase subunit